MNVFKQIRISQELLDRAKVTAISLGLSVSGFIRQAIIEKIKRSDKE